MPVNNELAPRAGQMLQVQHAVVLVPCLASCLCAFLDRHHMPLVILLKLVHRDVSNAIMHCR